MEIGSISRLHATNYKNLHLDDTLVFRNLNILIGPNGSGKSNFARLFSFLQESLEETTSGATGYQKAIERLGASQIINNSLPLPEIFTFRIEWEVRGLSDSLNVEHDRLMWELTIYVPDLQRGLPLIETEKLGSLSHRDIRTFSMIYRRDADKSLLYKSNRPFNVDIDNLPPNRFALQTILEAMYQKGLEIGRNGNVDLYQEVMQIDEDIPARKVNGILEDQIKQWKLYNANNIDVKRIRGAENKIGQADSVVSSTGDNLIAVLHNLMQELDFDDQINETMRGLFGESRRLRVRPFGRTHLGLEWWDSESAERPLFLDEMSDGTIRMLCWATILNSPKLPPLLILEEPEVGLHPAWLRTLAKWIKRASERTQVIMSTHSPDLLDKFTDSLESVIVFERDPDSKAHNIVRRLTKERVVPFLEDGWELGDMYRVGEPAVGGWPW